MRVNKPGFLASILALVLISGIIAPASDLSVNVWPIEPVEDYELSDGLQLLERNWTIQVTFVGYSESKINQTLFLQTLPSWHDANYSTGIVRHRLNYTLVFANETYEQNLKSNMSAYSNPSAIGTSLNETEFLSYLNGTDAAQDAFSSRSGIAIDGPAVESWIASNPAPETSNINWNLYLLNFTELDSSDHATEHWFSYPVEDPDSGRQIDWFTLPTGEVLQNIVYQYVGAAGQNTNVLLDPSADQWYLRYAMLQYNSSLPLDGSWPLHMSLDLDDIQRMNNLELAEGKNNLSTYLGAYCRDVMSNLFSPGTEFNHGGLNPRGWFNMLLETVNLQLRVFTVDSDIVPDTISWTLNDTIIREMFSIGLWTQTSVTVEYESLEDAPGWEALYWDHAETIEGTTYVNGTNLAVDIDITFSPVQSWDRITLQGVIFLQRDMVMKNHESNVTSARSGFTFVICRALDSIYEPDETTTRAGVTQTVLRELGYALGLNSSSYYVNFVADYGRGVTSRMIGSSAFSYMDLTAMRMMQFDQVECALVADFLDKNSTFSDQATYLTYRAMRGALSEFSEADKHIQQHHWSEALVHLDSAANWTRRMWWSKLDRARPQIASWGIEGNISTGDPYRVWAIVEDTMSGIENVSVIVRSPHYFVIKPLLHENGTHWVIDLPPLSINGTWEFWIESFDWAMNVASSFSQSIDYSSVLPRTIDPSETLVVVVVSSAGLAAATIVLAVLYDRRRLASSA